MSRFSSILGSLSDTRAEALNDATRERNWEGSLKESATDLIKSDIQKMKEEDARRIAKRKERQKRREEEKAKAKEAFVTPVFSSEGEEEPMLQNIDEAILAENSDDMLLSEISTEVSSTDVVVSREEEMDGDLLSVEEEDTDTDTDIDAKKDVSEEASGDSGLVFFDEPIKKVESEEDRTPRRRECVYFVPAHEEMTDFRRQIEGRRVTRLVREIYRTDENTFNGRRMIFELLEELFEVRIPVTEFHIALEDFHMQYDMDRGERWLKEEKENPLSQWGKKLLPFPTKEQLKVLLSWGYQEDGSFQEPET